MCNCNYYIYDKEKEQFVSVSYSSFEAAEHWIELNGDYERFDIYEKLT